LPSLSESYRVSLGIGSQQSRISDHSGLAIIPVKAMVLIGANRFLGHPYGSSFVNSPDPSKRQKTSHAQHIRNHEHPMKFKLTLTDAMLLQIFA